MSLPTMAAPDVFAKACEDLRTRTLFADEDEEGATIIAPPECEQYMLLALAALEQAERFARLAEYKLRRGE